MSNVQLKKIWQPKKYLFLGHQKFRASKRKYITYSLFLSIIRLAQSAAAAATASVGHRWLLSPKMDVTMFRFFDFVSSQKCFKFTSSSS